MHRLTSLGVASLVILSLSVAHLSAAPLPKKFIDTIGMKFVKLPKGTFYMGGGGGKAGKKTEIATDFEIAVTTVTQGQWQAVMTYNASDFSRTGANWEIARGFSDADLRQFPVESVSWFDTQEFIKKLNERERDSGWTYRLPTEAEWEYACRGGATSEADSSFSFYSDKPTNDLSSEQANFNGRRPAGKAPPWIYLDRPTKVGSYKPNRLGLYDMHGNVWQWCQDRGPDGVFGAVEPGGETRVYRGSGWYADGSICQASARAVHSPTFRHYSLGFRLVRVSSGDK